MADRYTVFKENISMLRCPLCAGNLYFNQSSLKCVNGHDFSLGRKGYCDFAPGKHSALYTKELFECRRRTLRSRLYAHAIGTLSDLTENFSSGMPVLDAGCGEGTFLLNTVKRPDLRFGVDLAREGVRLAASGGNGLGWAVADLAALPFKDGSFGAVLNILSPAAYPEFKRVLAPGGVLIKAVPGDRYLAELRELTGKAPHSNESVISLFEKHFKKAACVEVEDTFSLTPEEALDLCRMTPLTEHTEKEPEFFSALTSITVHLCFLVGKPLD